MDAGCSLKLFVASTMTPQYHLALPTPQLSKNLPPLTQVLHKYNSVRVHPYNHPQHIKVLKPFVYIWYRCGMPSEAVCSLNHTGRPRWLDFERNSSKMTSKIAPSEKFLPNLTESRHRIALSLFQNSYYDFPYMRIFLYWFLHVEWLWVFIASLAYLLGPSILIVLNIKLTKNELN